MSQLCAEAARSPDALHSQLCGQCLAMVVRHYPGLSAAGGLGGLAEEWLGGKKSRVHANLFFEIASR